MPEVPVRRGQGRPRKHLLIDAIAIGRQLAGGEIAPHSPAREWLDRKTGKIRVPMRTPHVYKPPRDPFAPYQPPAPPVFPRLSPEAVLLAVRRDLCTRSLAEFFRAGWHVLEPTTPLEWNWHHDAICDHVQAVIEDWAERKRLGRRFKQRIRDLLVSIGPGTAKSRIGVFAIAWAWLRWPDLRVVCLSANPRVTLRDSTHCRRVIASDWYQETFAPTWKINSDEDAKGLFTNTAGGSRSAIGLDARIVGTRGDLLWVDDPHDPEEANSDAQRNAVHDRWDNSIENRVNDATSSIRIGIAQRVHEDDWSSRRIKEGWTELMLPTEFEPERRCSTPLGFVDPRAADGDPLHADRFPPELVAKLKRNSMRWATLYQQRPAPAGGALVKTEWLRYWRRPGDPDATAARPSGSWKGPAVELPTSFDAVCIAADLAMGMKTKDGDFNVVVAVGKKGSAFYLLECWKARADFPEVQRNIVEMSQRYPFAKKAIEKAAAGGSLVASLEREIPGLIAVPPLGTKEQRLHAVLACFEAGNVHLSENWPGLGEAVSELITFPNSRHDDFVDALDLALAQLLGEHSWLLAAFGKGR